MYALTLRRGDDLLTSDVDGSTMITWSPTNPADSEERLQTSTTSFIETSVSLLETQETQETHYSDTSSIARFPTFHFNLHTLGTLNGLRGGGSRKMNFLLVVLEVDGPDTIRTKKGPEISILKMILGDDEGNMCKLTAWREVADVWGGMTGSVRVKRGDIVFLESEYASLKIVVIDEKCRCHCYLRTPSLACTFCLPVSEIPTPDMLSNVDVHPSRRETSTRSEAWNQRSFCQESGKSCAMV